MRDDHEIAPGGTFVLYTDGVTETNSPEGQEFGKSRLAETVRAHRNLAVDSLLETILATVQKFGGGEQAADITLVIARCRSQERPAPRATPPKFVRPCWTVRPDATALGIA